MNKLILGIGLFKALSSGVDADAATKQYLEKVEDSKKAKTEQVISFATKDTKQKANFILGKEKFSEEKDTTLSKKQKNGKAFSIFGKEATETLDSMETLCIPKIKEGKKNVSNLEKDLAKNTNFSQEQIQEKLTSFSKEKKTLEELNQKIFSAIDDFLTILIIKGYNNRNDHSVVKKLGTNEPLSWRQKQRKRKHIRKVIDKLKILEKKIDKLIEEYDEMIAKLNERLDQEKAE